MTIPVLTLHPVRLVWQRQAAHCGPWRWTVAPWCCAVARATVMLHAAVVHWHYCWCGLMCVCCTAWLLLGVWIRPGIERDLGQGQAALQHCVVHLCVADWVCRDTYSGAARVLGCLPFSPGGGHVEQVSRCVGCSVLHLSSGGAFLLACLPAA